jgi:hypothetical protein
MFPFTERHSLHHPPGYQTPSWLHPMGPVGQEAGVPATGFSFAQNSQAWRQPNGPHPLQQRPRPPSRGSTWRAPEVVETDTHAPWAEDLGSPTSLGSETSLESLSSPPTSQVPPPPGRWFLLSYHFTACGRWHVTVKQKVACSK